MSVRTFIAFLGERIFPKKGIADDANLSTELVKFIDELPEGSEATVDDFFDHCEIPSKHRTDFGFAAIHNGAKKIWAARQS